MALIDEVREAIRQKSTAMDVDLTSVIAAAKAEIVGAGAKEPLDDTDDLIKQAVKTYAKAHFGVSPPDMEKYLKQFDKFKNLIGTLKKYTT